MHEFGPLPCANTRLEQLLSQSSVAAHYRQTSASKYKALLKSWLTTVTKVFVERSEPRKPQLYSNAQAFLLCCLFPKRKNSLKGLKKRQVNIYGTNSHFQLLHGSWVQSPGVRYSALTSMCLSESKGKYINMLFFFCFFLDFFLFLY